MVTAYWARYIL